MRVFFNNNAIFTDLEVFSTISEWSKKYDACIIDTGAWNTAIPTNDIMPSNTSMVNLRYSGNHFTRGLGFEGDLPMFEADLLVGGDTYKGVQVQGIPMRWPILGREIISRYRWEINWKTGTVIAERI